MADPARLTGAGVTPDHLGTTVPTASLHEKPIEEGEKKPIPEDEDEEEEDMDALIEELESQDGHMDEVDEESTEPGGARPIPEELLQTDTRIGLTDAEVTVRRKKYGLNQMKEEKENLILKFLGYFVGPIQFVMEVSTDFDAKHITRDRPIPIPQLAQRAFV
jgi:H+-transporting ATPase